LATPPIPLEVYKKCIDLEKGSSGEVLSENVPRLRDLYERAIREYGSCSNGQFISGRILNVVRVGITQITFYFYNNIKHSSHS